MGRELLVVSLGAGRYGVPMECVDHILEYREPRPVPGATGESALDARGQVVALMRLGDRLGVAPCPPAAPAIVVVRLRGRAAGLVVDDVHEVILVGFERCERPPEGGEHLDAVVPLDGRLLMILDLPALLGLQPAPTGRDSNAGVGSPPGGSRRGVHAALNRRRLGDSNAGVGSPPGGSLDAPAVHPDCTGM